MTHAQKMYELRVLLSCIKSASREQGLAREKYRDSETQADHLAWLKSCDDAREYERRILELWA